MKTKHKFACKLDMIWERAEDYSASKWLKNDSRYAKETTREYTIARDAYYQGYLAAEKRTAWIATADTLPVNDEDVLVLCDGKVYLSYYEQPGDEWTVDGNVTHWMPLPEPMPLSIAEQDQLADTDKVMNSSKKLDSWISVKDRLPAVDTRVLVYEDGVTIVNAISSLNHRWDLYDNGENCRPTHWMPLPEPPEKI